MCPAHICHRWSSVLLGQKSSLTTSRLPVNARSILVDTIIRPNSSTSMKGSQSKGLKWLKIAKTYSKIAHITKA